LLLHSCCAPCSSYTLEYLSTLFDIDLFYYNPNIQPLEEYRHRLSEQRRLLTEMPLSGDVKLVAGEYDSDKWLQMVNGYESAPEGGERCALCIRERLEAAANKALELGNDCFSTTLTISPHKNADLINNICLELEHEKGIKALPLDLKKNDGYKRSIELSKQYNLYRQSFCGCIYSMY
jgi:predicted adenine nucleotide alpha hydrolase (AANH) superfamily ATPase